MTAMWLRATIRCDNTPGSSSISKKIRCDDTPTRYVSGPQGPQGQFMEETSGPARGLERLAMEGIWDESGDIHMTMKEFGVVAFYSGGVMGGPRKKIGRGFVKKGNQNLWAGINGFCKAIHVMG